MRMQQPIPHHRLFTLSFFLTAFCLMISMPVNGQAITGQKTFASPPEAVNTLVHAARSGDPALLVPVLGPEAEKLISSGDLGDTKQLLADFVKAYNQRHSLTVEAQGYASLEVGPGDWPFPFPIVRDGKTWYFDIERGNEEIVDRRVGRNELGAIAVCEGYVEAQVKYASNGHDGNPAGVYADRFQSTPGKQDGLYWPSKGDKESPMGSLIVDAAPEEVAKQDGKSPTPYHGYFYRMLTADGPEAPSGAKNYIVDGKPTGGFALIAYPADYRVTGVMTFIVNRDGVVYEQDLGEKTADVASRIETYNPDNSWYGALDE
jgi:Protein of unknown function (DUF2950)